MKRFLTPLLLLTLIISLLPLPSLAQEAEDITPLCEFTVSSKLWTKERLYDRDYDSYWNGEDSGKKIEINSQRPIHGLYLCWLENPKAWTLEEHLNGAWQVTELSPSPFMHQYLKTNGATRVRLSPKGGNRKWFGLSEIFVLGEGEVPSFVQRWQEPGPSCDLLAFFAHPDDESLFFGGTLPTYAGQRKLNVVACVFSAPSRWRRTELLNALWTMGVTNYPVFAGFQDTFSLKLQKSYSLFGETKVKRYVVSLFRQYKPKVVVTHDLNGEYGHGMHRMVADASLYAFDNSADPARFSDSAKAHGVFQVQKLYLHLYPENQITMNWDQPLPRFGGRTGFQMAQEGYAMHVSQQRLSQFRVEPRDSEMSSYLFGLARTTVGPDVNRDDFFEHIDMDAFVVKEP